MEFLRTIKKSIFDRNFYATARTSDFGSALKYYTLFILCIALIATISIYISFFVASSHINEVGDVRVTALAIYPDELVLRFENGQVVSNVAEPYSIPMPEAFGVKQPKNLVVINTRGTVTPADFSLYDTSAILGNDAVWVYNRQKEKIEIQKLDKFGRNVLVINKQKAGEWIDLAWNIGKKVLAVSAVFLPFLLFFFLWFAYLFYLLLGAVIIWIVASIRKADMTYGQAYKLGLYLITLPILYDVLSVASLSMFRVPFLFTLILIIVTYMNLTPTGTAPNSEKTTDTLKEGETARARSETEAVGLEHVEGKNLEPKE